MINKKFGLLLAASMLSLAACGEEQASEENKNAESEMVEQESTTETESEESTPEVETEPEEEPATEEQESTEEAAEKEEPAEEKEEPAEEKEDAEPMKEEAPAAKSGTASKLLSNGEMTSFVFNETGEFNIFCEPHPVMQMTVVVEEGAEQSGEIAVDIADYDFSEKTLTVAPGTTIVWTNQDQVQHNVAFE